MKEKMKSISKELVGASAIAIVLSVLHNEDSYGYELLQRIKEFTDGEVVWQEASMYPLLKKMENQSLIKSYWKMNEKDRPRKYYTLLDGGRKQLEYNKQEWQRLNDVLEGLWNPA
jgi:PadR family transcriptional regulator, regulatory protein PadR